MSERGPSSSAVYVYGVVGAEEPIDLAAGHMGPVRLVTSGDLAALCSDVDSEIVGRRRELKAHADVLSAACVRTAVVPFSFGTLFSDDDEVRSALLEQHADHLSAELDRLRDVLQFNLRIVPDEKLLLADVVAGSPELRGYRDRVASSRAGSSPAQQLRLGQAVGEAYRDAGERLGHAVVDSLATQAVDLHKDEIGGAEGISRATFLVLRERLTEFLGEVERISESLHGRVTCRLVGPLPPFAFVQPLDDSARRDRASGDRSWAS